MVFFAVVALITNEKVKEEKLIILYCHGLQIKKIYNTSRLKNVIITYFFPNISYDKYF